MCYSEYKTYNGWRLAGRVVRYGERGCFRNEYGDYMFHRCQTKRLRCCSRC